MNVLKMLYEDFIGSDAQKAYSLTYVWMANQFGHAFIGFGLSFLLIWFGMWDDKPLAEHVLRQVAIIGMSKGLVILTVVMVLYSFKEGVWDFWISAKPVLDPDLRRALNPTIRYRRSIALDCITDWLFVGSGAVLAANAFGLMPWPPLLVFGAILILWVALAWCWLPSRQSIEMINSPFFTRLFATGFAPADNSEWKTDEIAALFQDTIAGEPPTDHRRHIVIGGPPNHGKSTLAAALVIERVLYCGWACSRYITYAKLMESIDKELSSGLDEASKRDIDEGRIAVGYKNAEILLIDDVPFTREPEKLNEQRGKQKSGEVPTTEAAEKDSIVLENKAMPAAREATPALAPTAAPPAATPAADDADLKRILDHVGSTQLFIWVVSNKAAANELKQLLETVEKGQAKVKPILIAESNQAQANSPAL